MIVILALLMTASVARAGAYGKIGSFGGPTPGPDCSRQTPTEQEPPLWSRLSWSLGVGGAWSPLAPSHRDDQIGTSALAIVPQVSWQFWLREGKCAGGGGWLLPTYAWRRLSLAWSVDLVWRIPGDATPATTGAVEARSIASTPAGSIDLRPAVRLARSTFQTGFLSVGSPWLPSLEIAVTAGPTFDPRWSGAAVSFSGRAAILNVELRVAARTEDRGQEVMLLAGVTDIHGLWKLGPGRS